MYQRWPHRGIPVVDAHVHINPVHMLHPQAHEVLAGNPTYPLMERFNSDVQGLLDHMDREGIAQAWLVNYRSDEVIGYGPEVNRWIADYVRSAPERLIGVGGYDPRKDGPGDLHVMALKAMGIRALKLHTVHQHLDVGSHRADERGLGGAYTQAEREGMPVLIHTGTSSFPGADNDYQDPLAIEPVLEDFPKLQVIIAHGGRPHKTKEALDLVTRFDNAWLDVSSCPPKNLPRYFGDLEELADRTLWGSDWPGPKVPGMGKNVESFLELGYSAEANRKILERNARSLIPVDP